MSDRREHGTQIDGLRTATSTQISQVAAAKHALGQLREGLWASEDAADAEAEASLPSGGGEPGREA